MMRHWKLLLAVGAVCALALSVAAVAFAQASPRGQTRGRGVCETLMSQPQAIKAMQELRAEHLKDMQAWREQYGAGLTTTEAQQALEKLRQEHWNDMRSLLKRYGMDVAKAAGPSMMRDRGAGAGGCGGACGVSGVRGNDRAVGAGYGMMGGTY